MKKAASKPKRLIGIFLLTIVIPSVALGIFGLRAVRNERYRRERQTAAELQRTLALFQSKFDASLKTIEGLIQNTAAIVANRVNDFYSIKQVVLSQFRGYVITGQIFIALPEGLSFFPFLESIPHKSVEPIPALSTELQILADRARESEFVQKDYKTAILVYQNLYQQCDNNNQKAQILNHIARNQKRVGLYGSAVNTYQSIIKRYPESMTSSQMPLALTAEMQIVDCDRIRRMPQALNRILGVYEKLSDGIWPLNEDQYHLYTDMAVETIEELLKTFASEDSAAVWQEKADALKEKHRTISEKWQKRSLIESEIIPELKANIMNAGAVPGVTVHFYRNILNNEFLISATALQGKDGTGLSAFLGMHWDNDALIKNELMPIIDDLQAREDVSIRLFDTFGRLLLGNPTAETGIISVSGDFERRFPPWTIEVYRSVPGLSTASAFFRSYYFWTILTLLMILIFGVFLIVRTMARERDIMRIKSDFVSSVSHELKTPLTSIKALTERLLEGKVKNPDKMKQYFSVISQDADKLTRLVKNILDFSKIEEGKKEYHFEETDLHAWLEETIRHFLDERSHDRIQIQTQYEDGIPPLKIDRDELSQCINNLLDNAIKYSPGQKAVEVSLLKEPQSVTIRVKDNGVGIKLEEQDRIFDKFFQGSNVIRQSVKGTGLGLTLVKHAVEAHGGHIQVKSRPGEGTDFSIVLPMSNKDERG